MICIINFKTYPAGTGKKALQLARICERVAKREHANIAIAVQATDIRMISQHVEIPVLAQHVDDLEQGAHTGWAIPEAIKEAGAIGSLVNHSEHPLPLATIKETIKRLHALGLISVACAPTPSMEAKIAKFKPDLVAIEPPELIGGKISVSQAEPQIITQSLRRVNGIPLLCGAGIHTKRDVSKATQLGAQGILVASGVVNAKNPEKVLTQLVRRRV